MRDGETFMKRYFDKIYCDNFEHFIKELHECIIRDEKKFVITANPETFMIGQSNEIFDLILGSEHTTIVPDGIGIVKAANILGIPLSERVTGVEICQELLSILNKEKKSLFLFGAKKEVGELFCEKIAREYPGIRLLKYVDGYVQNKDDVMKEAISMEPDVMLVALGIPNQEILIDKYYDQFKKGIFIGVGGSFDVLSGSKKRAPKIFVQFNLEWLYRIVSEPKRIKRFYASNVKFIKEIRKMKKETKYEN